jgi:5-methylcytosine-specific restriction endonuclease McrA
MTKRCWSSLLPLPDAVAVEADQFKAVADAIDRKDLKGARVLLRRVNRDALWSYYYDAGYVYEARHNPEDHRERLAAPKTTIPNALKKELAERDGWTCQYCGVRLLSYDFIKGLNSRFPDEFPVTGIEKTMHPAALVLRYTQDHVVPRSAGGNNDLSNLVTCCGTCQYQKGDCTLGELALRDPPRGKKSPQPWDGLVLRFGPVMKF